MIKNYDLICFFNELGVFLETIKKSNSPYQLTAQKLYEQLIKLEEKYQNETNNKVEEKEGEGMCDSCKKYTKQGLYVKGKYLCRKCRK